MEQVQLKFKSGRVITGDVAIYSGNFVIVQTREVKNGNVVTSQEPYDLNDIASISAIREAEVRPVPELLVENDDQQ